MYLLSYFFRLIIIKNKMYIEKFVKMHNEYANRENIIRINQHIKTDCNIKFNKPDLVLVYKKSKTIKINEF